MFSVFLKGEMIRFRQKFIVDSSYILLVCILKLKIHSFSQRKTTLNFDFFKRLWERNIIMSVDDSIIWKVDLQSGFFKKCINILAISTGRNKA